MSPEQQASIDMIEFTKVWKLKKWSMECRHCERWINVQRDGALVDHKEGCHFAHEQHPWKRLRNILNSVAAESTDGR